MNAVEAKNIQLYSGRLRPNPGIPDEWSELKQARARQVQADVEAAFPDLLGAVDPDSDVEDHFEDACRISASYRATGGDIDLKTAGTDRAPWSDAEMARRLGSVTIQEQGGHHASDPLAGHPLVMEHGGRGIKVGGLNVDSLEDDVIHWLAGRHRDHGVKTGIVKAMGHKNGIWAIELDSDPQVVRERLLETMDWTFIRLEGAQNAVMAQDIIPMEFEYRLFIVDGQVVSSAGCVEEFTPLDRVDGQPFDTRVRRVRGHLGQYGPGEVEDRPDITSRLLDFGRKVASQYGGTVVIDVAMNAATDSPVIVEMNSIPNSGLYASDPWLVTSALLWAMDRGYIDLARIG